MSFSDTLSRYAEERTNQIFEWSADRFDIHNIDIHVSLNLKYRENRNSYVTHQLGFVNDFNMVLVIEDWITNRSESFDFSEYDSFNDDPFIGGFVGSWRQTLTALVCHESAHIIDLTRVVRHLLGYKVERLYSGEFKKLKLKKNLFKNRPHHNKSWKAIYSILRTEFLNDSTMLDTVEKVQNTFTVHL